MPRGLTPYRQALIQRQLWTPALRAADRAGWWDFSNLPRLSFGAGGITRIDDSFGGAGFLQEGQTSGMPDVSDINGVRAADFNSTNNRLFQWNSGSDSNTTSVASAFLVALVFSYTASGSNPRLFTFMTSTGGDDWNSANSCAVLHWSSGTSLITYQNNAARATTSVPPGEPHVFVVDSDGTTCRHYLNGTAGGSGAWGTISLGTVRCGIGVYNNATFTDLRAKLGVALVLKGAQSTLTRQRIEGGFAWRFGLQAKLPAAHPYRNRPPIIGG